MSFEPFDINTVYANAKSIDGIYTMAWYTYVSEHFRGSHVKLTNSQALRANIDNKKTEKELELWCLLISKLSIEDELLNSEVGPLIRDFYESYSNKNEIVPLIHKTIARIKDHNEREYMLEFCVYKTLTFEIIDEMELNLHDMMYMYQANEYMDYRSEHFRYMLQYIHQIKHAYQITEDTDSLDNRLYLARFVARTSIFAGSNLEQTMDASFNNENAKLEFLISILTKAHAWNEIAQADEYFKQLKIVINNSESLLEKRFPSEYSMYKTIMNIGAILKPSELMHHLTTESSIQTLELPTL